MSTAIKVVPQQQQEVALLDEALEQLSVKLQLDRFELAIKSRLEMGIKNDNDLRQADDLLGRVVACNDTMEAAAKPSISAAHALHKSLIAASKSWSERWLGLKDGLSRAIIGYRNEQARIARQQQIELERAAAAERKRLEAEARSQMRAGNVEAAQEVMARSQTMVAPVISVATPVLENATIRQPWQVQITDPMALVKAIAAGIVPLAAIKEWNETFFKREAATRGGLPANWAGVTAKQGESLAVKR